MYSIGDNGDPWGMSVGVGIESVLIPLNRIRVVLLFRNDSYPLCDFYGDSAFAHIVYKSLMMHIVESSRDIHEYC